jgi:XTP/dITP diphosphohydrolase
VTLYYATGNPGKLKEFRMAGSAYDVHLEPLPGFDELPGVVEDGTTFEENAVRKARHYARYTGAPVFADDSGLEVGALGGAPGVFSARYAGRQGADHANNLLLLENLAGVADRAARFVCAIALVEGDRLAGVWRGEVEGRILEAPRGLGGFGYDPLFYYEPFGCTFGEAPEERKLEVSHRGRALRAMLAGWKG